MITVSKKPILTLKGGAKPPLKDKTYTVTEFSGKFVASGLTWKEVYAQGYNNLLKYVLTEEP